MPSRSFRYAKALILACGAALALAGPAIAIAPGIPETEPNETAATAAPIPTAGTCFGFLPFGSIAPAGDLDYLSFPASAGDRVWSTIDTGGTPLGGSRDSLFNVIGPDGLSPIEVDDDGAAGTGGDGTIETYLGSAIAGAPLAATGTHFLRIEEVANDQSIDPYRLYAAVTSKAPVAETEINDITSNADPVPDCKTPIDASLSDSLDSDRFKLDVVAGQTLFVSADADPDRNAISTNLRITLRDPGGGAALEVDGTPSVTSTAPESESFGYDIPEGGTYQVQVRSAGGSSGNYRILVAENDVVPPVTTITSPPPALTNDPTPTIAFSHTDDVSSPAQIVAECGISSPSGLPEPRFCSGPGTTDTPPSPLTDDAYTYVVRGIDASGNGEQGFATADFEIDTVPPTLAKLKAKVKGDDAKLKFIATDANGIADLKCKVDKKSKDCDAQKKRKFKNLDDGKHKASVTATDVAGNTTTVKKRFKVR